MKIVAIIQARMASTRLPGKVLLDVCGKPLLRYVVERTQLCHLLDDVIVATGDIATDDVIANFCYEQRYPCFRGHPYDVLKRYADAASSASADVVVRITSDCPLIDPDIIAQVINTFKDGGYDYVSNEIKRTFPHGLDVEVFSRAALDRADRDAQLEGEREHVTRYICTRPELFHIGSVTYPEDFSHYRWAVDKSEDLTLIRKIIGERNDHTFSWKDIVALMHIHPEWQEINRKVAEMHVYT